MTLHDFPPYRSSILRHPTKNPRLVDPETIELWSPAFGQRDVAAIESDLTLQHTGEPQGERMTVRGASARLVGPTAREPADRAVAGQRRRTLHPPARPASGSPRPELHRRRPHRHERQRRVQVHDDQARRLPVEEPRERVAARAHPLLGVRLELHAAHRHADVLPGRPAVPARSDLQHHPPPGRPRPAHRPATTTTSRCPSSRWATGGTSWSTARMPPGSSPRRETTDVGPREDPPGRAPARPSARSSPSASTTRRSTRSSSRTVPARSCSAARSTTAPGQPIPDAVIEIFGADSDGTRLARAWRVPPRRPHLHRLRPRGHHRRRALRVLDAQPRLRSSARRRSSR